MAFGFGEQTSLPDNFGVAYSDAECAEMWSGGVAEVVLAEGELAQSLGARDASPTPGGPAVRCLVDVIQITGNVGGGSERTFHSVSSFAFGSWWFGEVDVVTSSGSFGGYETNPRAHPGDGLLDLLHVDPTMRLRQRWQCRRKMVTGSHLPHPQLRVARGTEFHFMGPRRLTVDGVSRGQFVSLSCMILPKVLSVLIPLPVIDIASTQEEGQSRD